MAQRVHLIRWGSHVQLVDLDLQGLSDDLLGRGVSTLRIPHDPSDSRTVKTRRRGSLEGVHQSLFRSDRLALVMRTEWYSYSQGCRAHRTHLRRRNDRRPDHHDCDLRPLSLWQSAIKTVLMVVTMGSATLDGHLHPITGAQNDYDSLFDLVGDRGLSSSSVRPLMARTTSMRSGLASPVISSMNVDSTPWRSRRTGPMPTGSTATSWGSQMTPTPTRHSRTSGASRPGCGGIATFWPSFNGFAPATTPRSIRRSRRDSTGWTSTACEPRWKPS